MVWTVSVSARFIWSCAELDIDVMISSNAASIVLESSS